VLPAEPSDELPPPAPLLSFHEFVPDLSLSICYSEFSNNTFAVDLLYYVLSRKKKSFASFSSWICEGTGTLKEDIKVGAKLSFTNDLSFVEIFGKRVPVNGMQVYIKDALIKSIDYNEDGFTIKYTSDYVKLIPKK